jgi:bacterioferritin
MSLAERAPKETATMTQPRRHSRDAAEIVTIRRQARTNPEQGSVTEGYAADREVVLGLLDAALATELVCYLRYKRHYFAAQGLNAEAAANEFLEHATQELQHSEQIAARIVQLGGLPDFAPETLATRSHADYVPGTSLEDMIREDLVAERIAIDSYRLAIRTLGEDDPTTRTMLESILAVEEEHADDLAHLLKKTGGPNGRTASARPDAGIV